MHVDPEPWTISGDRVVAETPLFRVRAEQCATADGYELAYYLIDTADWVNVVAVTEELELVAVRQYRHAARAITLEIPAGSCQPAEDPVTAGVRELLEETGYHGAALLLRTRYTNPALLGNRLSTLLCYPVTKVSEPAHEAAEHTVPVLIQASEWLEVGWAAGADHLLTALAIHDVLAQVRPATPVRATEVAHSLSAIMSVLAAAPPYGR